MGHGVGLEGTEEVGVGVQPVAILSSKEINWDCPSNSDREGVSDGWSGGRQDVFGQQPGPLCSTLCRGTIETQRYNASGIRRY